MPNTEINYLGQAGTEQLITNVKTLLEEKANKSDVPDCTTTDNGKFLRVVNGAPTWASVPSAEEATF